MLVRQSQILEFDECQLIPIRRSGWIAVYQAIFSRRGLRVGIQGERAAVLSIAIDSVQVAIRPHLCDPSSLLSLGFSRAHASGQVRCQSARQ